MKETNMTKEDSYKTRYNRLSRLFDSYRDGTINTTLDCPIDLLKEQHAYMKSYLRVLEKRAEHMHINLKTTNQHNATALADGGE